MARTFWDQRRFLPPGSTQFYYLDLKPETVVSPGGKKYERRALLRWGPSKCFYADHLYTLRLGALSTDVFEHQFFGPLDAQAA